MIKSYDNTVPYLISYHSLKAKYYKNSIMYALYFTSWLSGSLAIIVSTREGKNSNSKHCIIAVEMQIALEHAQAKKKEKKRSSKQDKRGHNPTDILRNIKIQVEL